MSLEYAHMRIRLQTDFEQQIIQHYLAEMATEISASCTSYHVAIWLIKVRMIKEAPWSNYLVQKHTVLHKAVQIHGGMGYFGVSIERYYRDARITSLRRNIWNSKEYYPSSIARKYQ
jgi:acyl-CoA dehydrogenase